MKQVTIVVVLLLVSQTFASNVVQLDDSNFDEFISDTSVALVAFTTTWCYHSQQFQPIFEQAADILKIEDPTKTLINVDCDKGEETCEKYDIKGLPSIKLFKNGNYDEEYPGNRNATEIVSYMKSQSVPIISLMTIFIIILFCIVCVALVYLYFKT